MFSLVIPTYNRASILNEFLTHLFRVEGIAECEVIVVNDGSTDNTAAVLEAHRQKFPGLLRLFELENGGPARARNLGVRSAKHSRILFIDDDVFPRPNMLQSHRRLLDAGYTGSQGMLFWHPDIAVTPLIRYIDSRGSQFAFDQVKDPGSLDFSFIYTGNFAVSKPAVLEAGGFDETFTFSAFEDTVLGYNLQKNGARLGLNKEAAADHLHHMTEDSFLYREYKMAYSMGVILEKYPSLAQQLGLDRKDLLITPQAHLLQAINKTPFVKQIFGSSVSLRLRHREAFCRGLLQFKEEAAERCSK